MCYGGGSAEGDATIQEVRPSFFGSLQPIIIVTRLRGRPEEVMKPQLRDVF